MSGSLLGFGPIGGAAIGFFQPAGGTVTSVNITLTQQRTTTLSYAAPGFHLVPITVTQNQTVTLLKHVSAKTIRVTQAQLVTLARSLASRTRSFISMLIG